MDNRGLLSKEQKKKKRKEVRLTKKMSFNQKNKTKNPQVLLAIHK